MEHQILVIFKPFLKIEKEKHRFFQTKLRTQTNKPRASATNWMILLHLSMIYFEVNFWIQEIQ